MATIWDLPGPGLWDAKKFATRYGFNSLTDFYVNGDGKLVVFPPMPDNPPIFELPDPPIPQGVLSWEDGGLPNTVRLVATFNGKKSTIVGMVGLDSPNVAMYQPPGPQGSLSAGPRREWHVSDHSQVVNIPAPPVDGDTLYVEGDGEYRHSNGAWRRVLHGPVLGSAVDQVNLYAALDVAMDNAINPPTGPNIDPRIKAVLVELRKLI